MVVPGQWLDTVLIDGIAGQFHVRVWHLFGQDANFLLEVFLVSIIFGCSSLGLGTHC